MTINYKSQYTDQTTIKSQISTPFILFEAFGMEKCFFSFDVLSYPILLFQPQIQTWMVSDNH
jgi:hypothetical protein